MRRFFVDLLLIVIYAALSACYAEAAYRLVQDIVRDYFGEES